MPTNSLFPTRALGALLIAGVTLASPRLVAGQPNSARPDSVIQQAATSKTDDWFGEGRIRIRKKRYTFFVGVMMTEFTSAASRAAFGANTFSPTFELYRPQHRGWSPMLELNGTRIQAHGASARVFAATVGFRYRFLHADRSRWLVPVVGLGAGPRVTRTTTSERTTVAGVSAQVELEALRSARLTVRYNALPAVHGERLSTLGVGVAFRLLPHRRAESPNDLRP